MKNGRDLRNVCKIVSVQLRFSIKYNVFDQQPCFLSSSTQNHAEPFRNYLKKSALDPNRSKLNQNSDFGHVQTCQSQSRRTSPCQQSGLFLFVFFRNYTFPILISKFIIIDKVISFIKQIYDLLTKSNVLLSKFMIFTTVAWINYETYKGIYMENI